MKYSEKEIALIKLMGYSELINNPIEPPTLYNIMGKMAFVENRQDKAAESLRKCLKAFNFGWPYRMTKEWDDLIDV
jgi:hypothetical protein